jgi:hypothetical protein
MRRRWLERIVVALLVVGFLVGAVVSAVPSEAKAAPTPMPADWVCPVGGNCHVLLMPGAEVYVLTAEGHVLIEINGDDSVRLENVAD